MTDPGLAPGGRVPVRRAPRHLVRILVFLLLVLAAGSLIAREAARFFMANPTLNALILGVLAFGIVFSIRQVLRLQPEAAWLEGIRAGDPAMAARESPPLLAPLATMLRERGQRVALSAPAMRSVLDGILLRLDETREISRYLIGLLIFLGLLGTFWGLLQTVSTIGATIQSLNVSGSDASAMFDELRRGLEAPLGGLGTAFASSLFGLAGSLVLGFVDLQAGQAQNRFTTELEDWLAGIVRIGPGGPLAELEGGGSPAYVQALLEQTADHLEVLQRTIARSEDQRASVNQGLLQLAERMAGLTDQIRTEQHLLTRLVEGQDQATGLTQRLVTLAERQTPALDEASRAHLANLDVYLARLLEDQASGRQQVVDELRAEIKLLTRTIVAISGTDPRA
ncbi:flagellar motor protein MotA [Zavarzinia sp. CC-PAN008]|uniref:flagellar motor protein MotA n=1 Tax=Zavarzinia sp. CC-PAN008 TaxID=3243332 RepID=UPI003F74913D